MRELQLLQPAGPMHEPCTCLVWDATCTDSGAESTFTQKMTNRCMLIYPLVCSSTSARSEYASFEIMQPATLTRLQRQQMQALE